MLIEFQTSLIDVQRDNESIRIFRLKNKQLTGNFLFVGDAAQLPRLSYLRVNTCCLHMLQLHVRQKMPT